MHGAKYLASTNNTNNYAGVRQFADWSKTAVMCLCTQAVWPGFLHASLPSCTSCERSFNVTIRLRPDDMLTYLTLAPNIMYSCNFKIGGQ